MIQKKAFNKSSKFVAVIFFAAALLFTSNPGFASEWWTSWKGHSHKGVRNCGAPYVKTTTDNACKKQAKDQARPGENLRVVATENRNISDKYGKRGFPHNDRYCKVSFQYRCKLSN